MKKTSAQSHHSRSTDTHALAMVFPLLAVLIWAGNTIIAKVAATVIEPAAITFYRWLIAAVLMAPFLLWPTWKNRQIVKRYLGKLVVLALLGVVFFSGFVYLAAKSTSATNMGIIMAIMPLTSAILSSLFAVESLTVGALLGGILSIVGLAILLGHGHPTTLFKSGVYPGDAWMLAQTTAYAAYSVLLRRWAVPMPPWQLLYVQIGFAILLLLPWYLLSPSSPITARNFFLILYAALPTSILAPYLWMRGIHLIGPNRTSLFINLLPVCVALIAALLFHEPLHGYHLIGGAMTLAGVWLGHAIKHPLR